MKVEIILELLGGGSLSVILLLLEIPDELSLLHQLLQRLCCVSLVEDELSQFQLEENRLTLRLQLFGLLILRILKAFLFNEFF